MNDDGWVPPPVRDRVIIAVFVIMLVATAIGLALFARVGG